MRLLFSLTLFLSAALLFVVEPLFAKMVLPRLGGTPAVWNTCMVFFQAALLAGYAYAHGTGRFAKQPVVHALLLFAPVAVLPIALPASWTPPADASPIGSLLGVLCRRVGLPFFVLAASGPLIQRWFARTGEKDPYYLYAASNLGSMIGLLGYPLLLEPRLTLAQQSALWSGGYGLLLGLTVACAVVALRSPSAVAAVASEPAPPISKRRALRWIALAAVPSAQMLGVTTYMTTDVAAVPLLWVIPLAIYLLSFILVFAKGGTDHHALRVRAAPLFLLVLAELLAMGSRDPLGLVITAHLVAFFVVCMICHGELAKDRPPASQLTAFYLLLSVGGLVGGTLTSLVAPFVFKDVLEYPIALVAACALLPDRSKQRGRLLVAADVLLPLGVGLVTLALQLIFAGWKGDDAAKRAAVCALPVFITLLFAKRPVRLALGVAAVFVVAFTYRDFGGKILHQERSFFGIHRVTSDTLEVKDAAGVVTGTLSYRSLMHGTTRHGMQRVDAALEPTAPREALTYYRSVGPIGQVMREIVGPSPGKRVAVVGLGSGSLAAYVERGQRLVYFEIDPAVERIAEHYFTFLSAARARGGDVSIVLGDARLTLARSTETFDVLAVDAFSSDAIPLHLVTREALRRAYLPRLTPHGVLLFHVSNRYLDLRPILADLAGDSELGCRVRTDVVPELEKAHGFATSTWVMLFRRSEDLGPLSTDERWVTFKPRSPSAVWTDDRSDLLSAIAR